MPRTIPPPVSRGFPDEVTPSWGDLVDQALRRGIVSEHQAQQLRSLAAAVPAPPPATPVAEPVSRSRARAFVAEALGYVGGALVVVAGLTLAQQFWADLRPWAHVAVLAVLSATVLAAGWSVRGEAGTPLGRLRSVLLGLGTGAVAGTTGVWAVEVAELEDAAMAVTIFAPATAVAALLWWQVRRSVQEVLLVIGLVATSTSLLALSDVALEAWAGLLVWGIGVAWLVLALGAVATPVRTGLAIGAIVALVGPTALADAGRWGALLGLATAGALAALSVPTRATVLLGAGVVGLFVYVPQVVFAFFGDQLGAPLALVVTGGALLGVAVWLARARGDGPGGGPA